MQWTAVADRPAGRPSGRSTINGPSKRGKYRFIIKKDGKQIRHPAGQSGRENARGGSRGAGASRSSTPMRLGRVPRGLRARQDDHAALDRGSGDPGDQIDQHQAGSFENATSPRPPRSTKREMVKLSSEHNARLDALIEQAPSPDRRCDEGRLRPRPEQGRDLGADRRLDVLDRSDVPAVPLRRARPLVRVSHGQPVHR